MGDCGIVYFVVFLIFDIGNLRFWDLGILDVLDLGIWNSLISGGWDVIFSLFLFFCVFVDFGFGDFGVWGF